MLVIPSLWMALTWMSTDPPTRRGLEAMSVQAGYEIRRAAGPPLTERPLMGSFDDRGRLYLAESAGLNLNAEELNQQTPNFVRRLEDVDGDGVFDKSTIFADKMTFPMGALWYRGSVFVASPPYIWKLTDVDDDGVADRREKLVGKFGFIGNAADIHGCFLSPGGRIVWCDGRHGHEFVDEAGKVQSTGKAARIFSCWPDGSDVRWHAGGGMDNPVEVDFTPEGEMLGVVNLFYQKRGDCLVHWLHGGVYPRDDQPLQLAEFKRTGDLLGPVLDFGHVAVSGMLRHRGGSLAEEHRDSWFVCEFNTHKLVRTDIVPAGSTYAAEVNEFLASSDPDCHPTDVIEDADGSLLVIDTGGWFRNGCPTSQVAKPEITGGVYRVRAKESPMVPDPRGLALDWEVGDDALLQRLCDDRPAVVERATDLLARRAESSTSTRDALARAMTTSESVDIRRQALWAWARTRRPVPAAIFTDRDESVRHALATSAMWAPSADVTASLIAGLQGDPSLAVRRACASALGSARATSAVPALLKGLTGTSADRSLEHALIYALVEIADPRATSIGLAADSAEVRRGALIALDQMDGSALTREQVVPLLDTGDGALQRSAIAILARHPEWSVDLLDAIHPWLQEPALSEERAATIRGSLVALAEEPRTEAFLAEGLASPSTSISARLLLLDVVARSGRESLPGGWVEGIRRAMSAPDLATRLAAIEATRDHPSDFTGDLTNIARDASVESRTRQSAARRLAAMGGAIDDSLWPTLVAQLSSETPPLDRMAVAEAIGQAGLSSSQREELIEHIGLAGPVELPALLSAFERPPFTSKEGESLADALAAAPGFVNLSARRVEDLFARHSSELRPRAELLVRTLRENQSARVELLDVIGSIVPRASAERGRALFAGTKSACSSCHQVAGQGGRIGPDLSKIGGSRDVRSLVESVVLPSMSFARGYESFNIVTDDGRSFTGVIARESLEDLWIRTADRSEIRLARRQIEEFSASQRSMMPEGLDKLLAPEELADIVAYLISLK